MNVSPSPYPSTIRPMSGVAPVLVGVVVGGSLIFGTVCDIRRAFALRRESRQRLSLAGEVNTPEPNQVR